MKRQLAKVGVGHKKEKSTSLETKVVGTRVKTPPLTRMDAEGEGWGREGEGWGRGVGKRGMLERYRTVVYEILLGLGVVAKLTSPCLVHVPYVTVEAA